MNVLFVQEEPFLATALQLILLKQGYNLILKNNTISASQAISETNPHLVITNIAEKGGLDFLLEAKKHKLPVIVISENGGEENLEQAFLLGANDYVSLPICITELALRVNLLAPASLHAA